MKTAAWIFLAVASAYLAAALVSCAQVPAAIPATKEIQKAALPSYPLSWEKDHSERKAWSLAVRDEIALALPSFDKAKDVKDYCPRYNDLLVEQRINVWSEMVSRIAKFESGWKPTSTYQEPKPPNGPGTLSVGLLQLSTGDRGCPKTVDGLKDPIKNLQCGVGLMKFFIDKDGLIAKDKIGIARYWSVMRPGHHIDEIKASTRSLAFCL